MDSVDRIRDLLDQGNYPEADRLANEQPISEQSLEDISTISEAIERSLSLITSLESRIKSYNSQLRNIKDTAFEIEEKEQTAQVQHKNLSEVAQILSLMIQNLAIPDRIKTDLLGGDLNDDRTIARIEAALTVFEKCLQYQPDHPLQDMKCVQDQREQTQEIKVKFGGRVYRYITFHTDALISELSDSLSSESNAPVIHNNLALLENIVNWLAKNDESTYQSLCSYIKCKFDHFIEQQLKVIREAKAPKLPKCGVLGVVKNFERFAKQVESLFANVGSWRNDLDRWYPELVTELFKVIEVVEHNKTPNEMIRLENYNYLHNILRSIKVPCLEGLKKEANLLYKASLNAYVSRYFGRPLERVNIFFEGVQEKLASGIKEEEISFQLAFSKQELRKVLQQVNLKEVRRGLEDMYKRIEKHASEPDSNLIQVIWYAMQDEFLSQYKAIHGMIERCYPSSNLGLPFTIDDILQVFSDIAQQH